jgi:hypothetical protein
MTDRITEHSDNYIQLSFMLYDVLVIEKVLSEYIKIINDLIYTVIKKYTTA